VVDGRATDTEEGGHGGRAAEAVDQRGVVEYGLWDAETLQNKGVTCCTTYHQLRYLRRCYIVQRVTAFRIGVFCILEGA